MLQNLIFRLLIKKYMKFTSFWNPVQVRWTTPEFNKQVASKKTNHIWTKIFIFKGLLQQHKATIFIKK